MTKTLGPRISVEYLRELQACKKQVKLFSKWLNGRKYAYPTLRNLRSAEKAGVHVWWLIQFGILRREITLENAYWAYLHANYIDKEPRGDTREAACESPQRAYEYAHHVDAAPREDTRRAACGSPEWAYMYAVFVDKQPRDDTREAAYKHSQWAQRWFVWEPYWKSRQARMQS